MKRKKCLLIQDHFLGRHQSFTEQNTRQTFSQNKFPTCLNNKGPTNNCLRPEVWKQMAASNTFPSKHMAQSVYKSSIYTYGGNLQGHQLLV